MQHGHCVDMDCETTTCSICIVWPSQNMQQVHCVEMGEDHDDDAENVCMGNVYDVRRLKSQEFDCSIGLFVVWPQRLSSP